MATKPLLLLAAVAGAAAAGYAAMRDQPQISGTARPEQRLPTAPSSATDGVRSSILRVEHYASGSCATLSVDGLKEPVLDSCHGWSITDCDGILLARSAGVRLDKAMILRSAPGDPNLSVVNLEQLLAEALNRKTQVPYEYLHFRLLEPQCSSAGATMPFEGSAIRNGATGPADPVKGIVHIARNGTNSVSLDLKKMVR
jgi:hypothetical protein